MLAAVTSPAERPYGGVPHAGDSFDGYEPDAAGRGRPEEDAPGWATCSRDVYAGLPFAGALYREDGEDRAWIEAFPPDEPGRIGDVRAYGPGTYVLELLTDGTRRGPEVRIEISSATRRASRGGSAPAPTLPADDLRAIEERARREAEAEAARQFDRQRRRLEEERDDALDDARRARGRADAAEGQRQVAQDLAAALREQLTAANAALSDERMQRASAAGEEGRRHLNELERVRRERDEARTDLRIAEFRLERVNAGDDDPGRGNAMRWVERLMESDAAGALLGGLAARFGVPPGTAPDGTDGFDELPPYTEPAALAAPPVPPFDYAPVVEEPAPYAGDGYAAVPAPSLAAPAADPVSAYDAVASAALAALEGAAGALDPQRFAALVAGVRQDGTLGADEWRDLGRDVLTAAAQRAVDASLVAGYLAPLLQPFAALLRPVLGLTARQALGIALPQLGIDPAALDKAAVTYLTGVVKALKAVL